MWKINIKNRIEEINKELEKITKLDKKFPQRENCNVLKLKPLQLEKK